MAGAFGDVTPVQNTLLDASLPYLAATKYQLGQNALATGQQDLADRSTLRGLALGLTSRDPNALGTAASLGASGQGAVNSLSTMDTQTAASKLAQLQYSAGLPQWGGPAPGGVPAAGGPANGAGSAAPNTVPVSGGFSSLADAVHQNESGGSMRPGIYGDGGQAAGPFQVHPEALADVNKRLGTNYTHAQLAAEPEIGKQVGVTYLHMMQEQFGRPDYALGAFNAGPGAMQRAITSGKGIAGLSSGAQAYVAHGLSIMHAAGHSDTLAAMMNGAPGPGAAASATPFTVPVQVASNSNARGMPQTATDASPAAMPVPPTPPAGGPPPQDNSDVTAVDSADGAQGLPAGARFAVAGGPVQVKPAGGTAMGAGGMSSQQAVAQAQQEFAGKQNGMMPDAANQQVIERARQLMQGGSAPESSFPLSVASSTPPQSAVLPARPPSRMDRPIPAGQPVNSLLAAAMPGSATGTPQSNALLASLGVPAPNALSPTPAPARPGTVLSGGSFNPAAGTFPPATPAAPAAAVAPQPANPAAGARFVTTGTGAYYTQGLPPGYAYAVMPDGSRTALPLPGTTKLEIKDAGPVRSFIDPHTGQTVRTEAIPDHSRMMWRDTPAGQQGYQSGQPVGAPIPFSGRPEQDSAYKADIERTGAITQSVQAAQAAAPRLNEMADLAQQLSTSGPGGPAFARAAAVLESVGVGPDAIKRFTGMSSGTAAQEFVKLNVQAAGADAKANVGSNTGIGSINLYQTANPGLALLPDANKRITNMMRVANQATQDYGQGALQHFGQNEQQFLGGKQYAPLTSFNHQWQAQNNPQVYAAATGILNGDSFDKWRARLSSPDEGQRAAQIAARIDPNVMIPARNGGGIPARQFLQRGQ